MTAEVVAIRSSTSRTSGWSPQELAEVFRLGDMLQRHGLDLAISYGISDEGDPWLVLSDPLDAEISFHIARIDQRYVVARGDSEEIAFKRHLREVADLLVPHEESTILVFGGEQEPLELYAVVALALAASEGLGQSPELKQAVDAFILTDRDANGRAAQREAEDRVGELARILIAAVNAGEPDVGRIVPAGALTASLAPPAPLPAQTPSLSQAAPRIAITVSIDIGQTLAPGQRDLAPAQVLLSGLAAGTVGAWSDGQHQDAATASSDPFAALRLGLSLSASKAAEPAQPVPVAVAAQIDRPSAIVDANPIITLEKAAAGVAEIQPATGVLPVAPPLLPAQLLDFSGATAGVRISLVDSVATVVGSHGFDLITVSGQTLVRIGDGGALVNIAGGENIIVGSAAASTVNIAGGHNLVTGGSGAQTVNIAQGSNLVTGGSGTQVVNIAGGTNTVVSSSGTELAPPGGTSSSTGTTANAADEHSTTGSSGGPQVVNISGGTNSVSGSTVVNVLDGHNTISGSSIVHVGGGTNTVSGGGSIAIDGGTTTVLGGGSGVSISGSGSTPTIVTITDGPNTGTSTLNGSAAHGTDASGAATPSAGIALVGGTAGQTDPAATHIVT